MRAASSVRRGWVVGVHYIATKMKTLLTFITAFGLAFTSFSGSTDQTTSPDLLLVRSYKVSANTFVAHLKHLLPPKGDESDADFLLRFFKQRHVEIKVPEAIFLNEKKDKLTVKATQANQDKIERLVVEIVGR
jgi:hypothetical protein